MADSRYTLVNDPSGPLAATNFVLKQGQFPFPYWSADNSSSKWIAPYAGGDVDPSAASSAGDYDFRTTFDLGGLDPTRAAIMGRWGADNQGVDILVNGHSTGQTANGFADLTPFVIDTYLQSGVNTIDFIVRNFPQDTGNPFGLRVDAEVFYAAPEPSTLVMGGTAGLMMLGFTLRRHRAKTHSGRKRVSE